MTEPLLLAKRLFLIGSEYTDKDDPVSAGIAISLFQDSVEIFIWSLLKHLDAEAKENTSFISFFDLVINARNNKNNQSLPFKAKMIEMNKSRVGFKHYGNLPDASEAIKFSAYTEEFLILSFSEFYSLEFDSLSIVDLVTYPDVRTRLKSAESKLKDKEFVGAIAEVAIAKAMLFEIVANYFPRPDRRLSDGDSLLRQIPGLQGVKLFAYLSEYLSKSSEANMIAMLGIQISDYLIIQRYFPAALHMASGEWHLQYHARPDPDEIVTGKAIHMIVSAAIRAQEIIGGK
jgi:hypothetical protein